MKATLAVIVFVIASTAGASAQSADAGKARDESFSRCDTPQYSREARYKSCQEYLEKYPNDNAKRRERADKFVRGYEHVMSYAKALQAFAIAQPNVWFIYEPDLKIDLPKLVETVKDSYKIEIKRSFENPAAEAMLRKAEAVYGPQFHYIDSMRSVPENWADTLPDEIAPQWGEVDNDNVMMTEVITASAVKYYYDLSISAREHRKFRNVFPMNSTSFKYNASVKHYDEWEHAATRYSDVYVADLNLEWGSACGGLCGIGFTRNKLVVFDKNSEVVRMYLDAAVNRTMWVS
jgi:hypothetical protein